MIVGAPGTGKDVAARMLHRLSTGDDKGFVAIPAFSFHKVAVPSSPSGYMMRGGKGWFEDTDRGSLFLDGLDAMPLEAQTLLLGRLSADGRGRPSFGQGANRVRLISAASSDLGPLIQLGLFRLDLFYRLNVVTIHLPCLRDRLDDIEDLVDHFFSLAAFEGLPRKKLAAGALERLRSYTWPGNVRELETIIRRLVALYPETLISPELVEAELLQQKTQAARVARKSQK
jgi:two-component system nitrogen regulation response regulator GlnG